MKMKTIWVLALVLVASSAFAAPKKKMPQGLYLGGGIAGTLVGFGLGHGIQGRYGEIGWAFTLSEVVGVGLMAGGGAVRMMDVRNAPATTDPRRVEWSALSLALYATGAAIYGGFRLWEIYDVWAAPYKNYDVVLGSGELSATERIAWLAPPSRIEWAPEQFGLSL